ncbi:MAG: hypothetical protein AAF702_29640 [Chloroflexota bacterium]
MKFLVRISRRENCEKDAKTNVITVTTRTDPPLALARLRARGQLVEIRMANLRFTIEEASRLLNEHLALNIADSDLQQLMTRTEGWAVGICLLGLSLEKGLSEQLWGGQPSGKLFVRVHHIRI